jgi:hypothetical protein
MAEHWKPGSLVRISVLNCTFRVLGQDSVGSTICEPLVGATNSRIYMPPSLLIEANPSQIEAAQVMQVGNS